MVEMVKIKANGKWDIILPKHRAERPEWHTEKGWERDRLDAINRLSNPGELIIDVGSEEADMAGLFALWKLDVFLIEPNERVWPNARAIWQANNFKAPAGWFVGFVSTDSSLPYGNQEQIDACIAASVIQEDGWPLCAHGPIIGDHGHKHLSQEIDTTQQETLDNLALKLGRKIDHITIDCEGSEYAVLQGAKRILTEDRPYIYLSLHSNFIEEMYGVTPDQVLAYIESFNYELEFLVEDHEQHWVGHPQ